MAESRPGINADNSNMSIIGDNNTTIISQSFGAIGNSAENLNVTQVREWLEETYKQMIDVDCYKEVWWSDEFINFNDIFTKEHAEIRPQKRNPKRNEESEEQSVILPDDFKTLFTYDARAMKRVCLVGEPGMGKTTQLINQVVSLESSPFLKTFPMLFYIPLNDLPADNACIYTYIYENLLNRDIEKDLPIDFRRFVRENADKEIFFLDGFDELKNNKAKEDIVHVTNELPKAHFVITTRESGGSKIITDPKFTIVSISGFKEEEVIDIMVKKIPQTQSVSAIPHARRRSITFIFKYLLQPADTTYVLFFVYGRRRNHDTIKTHRYLHRFDMFSDQ
ncbi:uncharacterized protein LOC141913982 [Tubulanus polymorphus]|uniref:uncharacterized protein LOC141913982 n=1 Tax=Tubulanus polymorphus TaxID=672921 RepID=UPI003DA26C1E